MIDNAQVMSKESKVNDELLLEFENFPIVELHLMQFYLLDSVNVYLCRDKLKSHPIKVFVFYTRPALSYTIALTVIYMLDFFSKNSDLFL